MADHAVLKALRAAVFAVVCVLAGMTGHTLSSGMSPPLVGLVAGVLLVAALSGWLTSRRRPLPVVVVATIGAQLGLHGLFDYTAAGLAHADHISTAHTGHATPSMTLTMACGHLVAGLLAAWWLHRGDTAVWIRCAALVAAVVHLVSLLTAAPVGPLTTVTPAPRTDRPPWRLRTVALRHSVVRRGPPSALLVH